MSRPLSLTPVLTLALLLAAFPGVTPHAAAQSRRHRHVTAASGRKPVAPKPASKAPIKPATTPDAKVALLGEVAKPGLVEFKPGMTVKQAVELVGGFTTTADTDNVTLRRLGQPTLGTLDGKKALAGDQVQNAALRPGDTLYIPRLADPAKAAADADGARAEPKTDHTAPPEHNAAPAQSPAATPRAAGGNAGVISAAGNAEPPGTAAAAAPATHPAAAVVGDLPTAPPDPGRLKFIGAIGSPGTYVYEAIALKPALEGAGGLTKDSDPRRIVVKRGVREDGKAAYEIKYDYEQVAKGKVSDLELLPGDVIEVPSHRKGGFFTQVGNGLKRLLPPAGVQRQIGGIMGRLLTVAAASQGVPVGLLGGGSHAPTQPARTLGTEGGRPSGTRAAAPVVADGAAPTALEAALVQAIFAEPPDVRERIIARVKAQLEK